MDKQLFDEIVALLGDKTQVYLTPAELRAKIMSHPKLDAGVLATRCQALIRPLLQVGIWLQSNSGKLIIRRGAYVDHSA